MDWYQYKNYVRSIMTLACCADKCHNPTKCHSPRQMSQQPSTNVTANDKCHNFTSTNVTANDKCHNIIMITNDKCHNLPTNVSRHITWTG